MKRLIARLWRGMRGSTQWRLLYLSQAKFMVGVTGVVRDRDGNVLLLRHRFWPEHRQWGLPTGGTKRGRPSSRRWCARCARRPAWR
ncbi:NUDIX hydrolase [Nonomuraea thailandensis]